MYDLAPPRSARTGDELRHRRQRQPERRRLRTDGRPSTRSSNIFNLGGTARQIYTWSRRFGTFQQITFGNADSTAPTIDYNADRIVFLSQADLLGEGATETNVYIWNAKAVCGIDGCFRMFRITNGVGASGGVTLTRSVVGFPALPSNQALTGRRTGTARCL
jgi:hypothetical protein